MMVMKICDNCNSHLQFEAQELKALMREKVNGNLICTFFICPICNQMIKISSRAVNKPVEQTVETKPLEYPKPSEPTPTQLTL